MMQTYLLSALTAFAVVLVLGPIIIPMLRQLKFGQVEREEGPDSHKAKQGTPTMGGIMTLLGVLVASLIFGLESASFVLPALLVTFAFGLVGFLDDFIKVRLHRNLGLRAYQKIIAQFGIALVVAIWAYRSPYIGPTLYLPISGGSWDIGYYYIPLVMFVVISTTNAVNLTDGIDGLAASVTVPVAVFFAAVGARIGNTMIYTLAMTIVFGLLASKAALLGQTLYGMNLQGMAVFSAAVTGACLGFIRYNTFPARVFMGDTGSLALGGAIAMMAIASRSILLLPIMGFCFVGSALSVILQVGSYKLRHGKRIFKMAPIHHHFELCGYSESRIVTMYTLVTTVLCAVCLLSYLR